MSFELSRFSFSLVATLIGYGLGMLSVPGPLRELTLRSASAAMGYWEEVTATGERRVHLAPIELELDTHPVRISLLAPNESATPHLESPLADYTRVEPDPERPFTLVSTLVDTPIFNSIDERRRPIGSIRRGFGVPGTRVDGAECQDRGRRGVWYEVDGGFACSTSGFVIRERAVELSGEHVIDTDAPAPYAWARVTQQRSPRFSRLPSSEDLVVHNRGERPPGIIEYMEGDFFMAIRDEAEVDDVELVQTVKGNWVLKADLMPKEPSKFSGEPLGDRFALPLAFAHREIDTWCPILNELERCGVMEKYARSTVVGYHERDGERFAELMEGAWVRLDELRVARRRKRPSGVAAAVKWVHFDLEQQTMVAYEGDEPVYATLISSGKKGHDTPTGLYRTERKYVTTTMRGRDPVEGIYHVEEVPWTMFYHGAYAVHGAYWHDTFGNVRSHGCTNLSVADSRWLFHWEELAVPSGWHASLPDADDERRAYFFFSRES